MAASVRFKSRSFVTTEKVRKIGAYGSGTHFHEAMTGTKCLMILNCQRGQLQLRLAKPVRAREKLAGNFDDLMHEMSSQISKQIWKKSVPEQRGLLFPSLNTKDT
jgi:hypothetical protein